MDARLYANITSLILSEKLDSSSAYSFPKLVAGKTITLKLALAQRIEGVFSSASHRQVHGLKASVGRLDARPEAGTFQLMIGDAPEAPEKITADLAWNATAEQVASAIQNVTSLAAEAKPVNVIAERNAKNELMAWRVRFADGGQRDITCVDNALWPLSFVEVTASEHDEGFIHRIKLTQAIAAQSVDLNYSTARAPFIERKQAGGSDVGSEWNEVQKLVIPPEFNSGTFKIKRGFARSATIGLPTSAAEITDAIAALADERGEWIVTEQQNAVLIEFGGEMGGQAHDLLEVEVLEAPDPSLLIELDTDTAALDVLMQRPDSNGEVKLPMEIELHLVNERDEEKIDKPTFRFDVSFLRPLNTAARNVAATINWNQPLARRDTKPYGPGQFLIGQRHAEFVIGDGSSTSFDLNHNQDTHAVGVLVRDNLASGRLWRDEEFDVTFDGLNAITVSFDEPPAANSLVVIVTTAAHPASFVAHGHTIGEIELLAARLAAIEEHLARLLEIAPSGGLIQDTAEKEEAVAQWTLPNFVDLYPTRVSLALPVTTVNSQGQASSGFVTPPRALAEITPAWLASLGISDGGLLPAIHRAAVVDLNSTADFGGEWEGTVFRNVSGGDIALPGKRGRGKSTLPDGEFAAYHQGAWYFVVKSGDTRSYFPKQFERTLFELSVNAQELRLKKTLAVPFGFEVGIVTNLSASLEKLTNSPRLAKAQWTLVVEWGVFGEDELTEDDDQDEVRDTAPNLDRVHWQFDKPLLKHRFMLTTTPSIKEFGVEIMVNAADEISANKIIAKGRESAPQHWIEQPSEEEPEGGYYINAPTSRDFALRARLIEFDTEDIWLPQGLVALIGLDKGTGSVGKNGVAQIT